LGGRAFPEVGRLATEGWLADAPDWFRDALLAAGEVEDFARGERIDAVGAMNDGLCGVVDGSIDFFIPVAGGRKVRGHRFGPGHWWGVVGILARRPTLSETVAAEPTRLFKAPTEKVWRIIDEHPGAWRCLAALVHINVGITTTLLGEALALPPTARLARRLLQLSDGTTSVSATLDELAEMIGVTRSTIQRSLGDLVRAGAVEKRYRRVMVRDRTALERIGGRG
jgi:CRP-like cAMP-binding protein